MLRFNNAPTDNHAKDVGKKTSIRIVNSQVVAKPQFKFLESKFYSKSAVLVWDPSAYNATLEEWYNKPDWPFFEQFFSKRLMQPEDALYLLHPGIIGNTSILLYTCLILRVLVVHLELAPVSHCLASTANTSFFWISWHHASPQPLHNHSCL